MHNDGCHNGGRLMEMFYYTNEYEATKVFENTPLLLSSSKALLLSQRRV